MPPKAIRRRAREQRATTHHLSHLNLGAQVSTSTSMGLSRDAVPRDQIHMLVPRRNYTPTISFDSVKVTIIIGSDDGRNFETLANVETIETTMGRAAIIGQIQGLITSHKAIYQALKDKYDITIPHDHRSTMISFTDAAAYRHRVNFETRWQPDPDFTIWAGEVESGGLGSERACECGSCGGIHGAEIEVCLDAVKVKAA